MPRLRRLDLHYTHLDPSLCAVLFDGFIAAGKMISRQDEMSCDAQVSGSGASQNGLSIEYLDLTYNDIGESVDKLAQAYEYMPRLRHLGLGDTNLKPPHCAVLFDAFIAEAGKMLSQQDEVSSDTQDNGSGASQSSLSIEHLDLTLNYIGDSVDKLLQALTCMSHLTYIDVHHCRLDEESKGRINEMLATMNCQFTLV